MQDYQGNAKRDKPVAEPTPGKNIEKVVSGTVIVKNKSFGKKVKDVFFAADVKGSLRYVVTEVLLPAARDMLFDSMYKGGERMIYGQSSRRRGVPYGPTSRVTYNNPITRGYNNPIASRQAPLPTMGPRTSRRTTNDFILATREEADLVMERMNDIIDTYQVASLFDLKGLIGEETNHVDNKWGWVYLADVQIRQTRDGYLLDLPPAEALE